MATMRCEAVRDALPALARGAFGDAETAAIREHLAGCDECAAAWAVVGELSEARMVAPAGLAERVAARAADRTRRAPAGRRTAPLRWLGGAGLAAAAVSALLVAMPDRDEPEEGALAVTESPAATDPFLDARVFGETTPTEAELDGLIRVAALDPATLPTDAVAADLPDDAAEPPPIALDLGTRMGEWPGADGISAGNVMIDQLTYDEMALLLTEMET